jgi:hypothetical protein
MAALPSGTFRGSCHCGSVQIEVTGTLDDFTTCDCTLCVKKNAVMYKVHEASLKILKGEDKLTLYQWNTRVAQHYFCSACGIYTFHRKRAAPDHYGVNVYCLDGVDLSQVPVRRVDGKTMSVVAT